jgi:hypothetical protein
LSDFAIPLSTITGVILSSEVSDRYDEIALQPKHSMSTNNTIKVTWIGGQQQQSPAE